MAKSKTTPEISKRTFWDVDINGEDFNTYPEWIICRIFDRGTLDEVYSIIKYYGFDFVKDVLLNTNEYLSNHAILLARAIFQLRYSDFKCSEKRPFRLHY